MNPLLHQYDNGNDFDLTITANRVIHSHLDNFDQPVAPDPKGGIKNANGNFGTPMMGVIIVMDADD